MALVLERSAASKRYRVLAEQIKTAFSDRFIEAGTGNVGIATQAAQATALYMGLVPSPEEKQTISRMVEAVEVDHHGHIAAGIFGTKYLLNTLSDVGHGEVAYQLADKRTFPGWGHMIENGATTLWETWAQSDNVFSQNHPMFGSISEWFFKGLGGLQPHPDAVGFDRFYIKPVVPSTLDWVEVSYHSMRGSISISWRKVDGRLLLLITIPIGTRATIQLPTLDVGSIKEGGQPMDPDLPVHFIQSTPNDLVEIELGSGQYAFSSIIHSI